MFFRIELKEVFGLNEIDLIGIWNANPEYKRNIISGMRPTFQIKEDYLTSGIIEFENSVLFDSVVVQVCLLSPLYYANSVWIGKKISVFDGRQCIGTLLVKQIVNPILDSNKEKWVVFDGRDINTTEEFFDVVNKHLTDGRNKFLGRNFNSFSDLLWGGFGIHEYEESLHIVWIFSRLSKEKLGKQFEQIIDIIQNHESGMIDIQLYEEHA